MNTTPLTLGPELSLGDIVNRYPVLARELERRGLDYCCDGAVSLGQACRARELDPSAVGSALAALVDDTPAPSWATMEVDELVDHIVDEHHAYLWDELPRMSALSAKVLEIHGDRHPELTAVDACVHSIRAELEPHLAKEERVLFPAVKQLVNDPMAPAFGFGSIGNPISKMLSEHDDIGELLRTLRVLTAGYTPPADGCASYTAFFVGLEQIESDTYLHVHKENNVLFPRVLRLEQRRTS